jgi:hypothetical protein
MKLFNFCGKFTGLTQDAIAVLKRTTDLPPFLPGSSGLSLVPRGSFIPFGRNEVARYSSKKSKKGGPLLRVFSNGSVQFCGMKSSSHATAAAESLARSLVKDGRRLGRKPKVVTHSVRGIVKVPRLPRADALSTDKGLLRVYQPDCASLRVFLAPGTSASITLNHAIICAESEAAVVAAASKVGELCRA